MPQNSMKRCKSAWGSGGEAIAELTLRGYTEVGKGNLGGWGGEATESARLTHSKDIKVRKYG